MDHISEALVKLIEAGVPLAKWVIILQFAEETISSILIAGVIMGTVLTTYTCIKKFGTGEWGGINDKFSRF